MVRFGGKVENGDLVLALIKLSCMINFITGYKLLVL
jgi:hypothetical protein